MAATTVEKQLYYILGCVDMQASSLSETLESPFENCRNFLIDQVVRYLEFGSTSVDLLDLSKHSLLP